MTMESGPGSSPRTPKRPVRKNNPALNARTPVGKTFELPKKKSAVRVIPIEVPKKKTTSEMPGPVEATAKLATRLANEATVKENSAKLRKMKAETALNNTEQEVRGLLRKAKEQDESEHAKHKRNLAESDQTIATLKEELSQQQINEKVFPGIEGELKDLVDGTNTEEKERQWGEVHVAETEAQKEERTNEKIPKIEWEEKDLIETGTVLLEALKGTLEQKRNKTELEQYVIDLHWSPEKLVAEVEEIEQALLQKKALRNNTPADPTLEPWSTRISDRRPQIPTDYDSIGFKKVPKQSLFRRIWNFFK